MVSESLAPSLASEKRRNDILVENIIARRKVLDAVALASANGMKKGAV
jgi:hypothetical protein